MMAGDLADRAGFIQRLKQAVALASRTAVADRGWTTEPPPWWQSTHTVAMRRALQGEARERLLAYRQAA